MENLSFACGGVAAALLISGGLKLAQPSLFLQFSWEIGIPKAVRRVTPAVPLLELIVGVGLISPIYRTASLVAALLTTLFVVAAANGFKVPAHTCGCFGSLDATTPPWLTLTRAVLLMTAAWFCFIQAVQYDQRAAASDMALGLLAGTGLAASLVLVGQIGALRRDLRAVG